ncbi:MAG: diaminopimelate epimerase [Ignavibacteriales bacterium]|nr:diaminopimelate epimerase [Ignavibacteriales bacterium]
MKIKFTKMSGAGNDFVVIDNRERVITDGSALAKTICDRRWGVGADGLLLVEKSDKATYKMMYYNADGSYGGMCGNGGRCIAYFTVAAGIAPRDHSLEALDYLYKAHVNEAVVTLHMKDPKNLKLNFMLPVDSKKIKAHYVDTGAPHVVIPIENVNKRKPSLESLNVYKLGEKIRYHKKFLPAGTNVNFIELTAANQLKMRTYERGVESETLACGTGSVASAIMGNLLYHLEPPITIIARSGSLLTVDFKRSGKQFSDISLSGPAAITFTGEFAA